MKAIKFILPALLLFFPAKNLDAQNLLTQGYIITNQGDSIYGEFRKQTMKEGSLACHLRQRDTEEFKSYTPYDIKAYRIDRSFFVAKEVSLEEHSAHIFAEFLVNGIVDLYYLYINDNKYYLLENDKGEHSYIDVNTDKPENDDEMAELKALRSRQIGTLKVYMRDYPAIFPQAEKVYFENNNSMKKLVIDYHDGVCDDYACIDYAKQDNVVKKLLGVNFGIGMPIMPYIERAELSLAYIEEATIFPSLHLALGAEYLTNVGLFNDRLQVQFKAFQVYEKYTYNYDLFINYQDRIGEVISSLFYSSLEINFLYLVSSNKVNLYPYLGLGLNFVYGFEASRYESENILELPALTPSPIRLNVNGGLCVDIPLKKANYHLRPTINMSYSIEKDLKYYGYYTFNYRYFLPSFTVSLVKQLN